jgi:hypothetical protein
MIGGAEEEGTVGRRRLSVGQKKKRGSINGADEKKEGAAKEETNGGAEVRIGRKPNIHQFTKKAINNGNNADIHFLFSFLYLFIILFDSPQVDRYSNVYDLFMILTNSCNNSNRSEGLRSRRHTRGNG